VDYAIAEIQGNARVSPWTCVSSITAFKNNVRKPAASANLYLVNSFYASLQRKYSLIIIDIIRET
jgi:hypothetical protein